MAAARVLLVEDEALIGLITARILRTAGYDVLGPADRLDRAMALARTEAFDAAVLDVHLAGVEVWPLAALLQAQGVPFIFVTGFGAALDPPPAFADVPCLRKPFRAQMLRDALAVLGLCD